MYIRTPEGVPGVSISPPRSTFYLSVYLPVGGSSFRAFHAEVTDPEAFMDEWLADWKIVAKRLWNYSGDVKVRKPDPRAAPSPSILDLF
jgi:hypothetical protein